MAGVKRQDLFAKKCGTRPTTRRVPLTTHHKLNRQTKLRELRGKLFPRFRARVLHQAHAMQSGVLVAVSGRQSQHFRACDQKRGIFRLHYGRHENGISTYCEDGRVVVHGCKIAEPRTLSTAIETFFRQQSPCQHRKFSRMAWK